MYSTNTCPWCVKAEALLREVGIGNYKVVKFDEMPNMQEMLNQVI